MKRNNHNYNKPNNTRKPEDILLKMSNQIHRAWKPLSAVSQPMNLLQFVFNSPKTKHEPNNRSERKKTAEEERIDTKLCEIILTIH